MTMYCLQPSDCDFLRGVACIAELDLYALLKAKGLSVNFNDVTTSSDASLQMYASLQCLTSDGSNQCSHH